MNNTRQLETFAKSIGIAIAPSLAWIMAIGIVTAIVGMVFDLSESARGLSYLITLLPMPFTIPFGMYLGYFYWMDGVWKKTEEARGETANYRFTVEKK